MRFKAPPNEPPLLNWTCEEEPPGEVAPLEERHAPFKEKQPAVILMPAVEERPAVAIPPEKVDVPVSVEMMRPESARPEAESWASDSPPEKVLVPSPFTFKRLERDSAVEEANWNEDTPEVAVMNPVFTLFSAVKTPPMSAGPLCTLRRVPGVEVPIPRFPVAVRVRSVEVESEAAAVPVGRTTRKRSALCPLAPRIVSGVELVLVASIVATVFRYGEVVPMANWLVPV